MGGGGECAPECIRICWNPLPEFRINAQSNSQNSGTGSDRSNYNLSQQKTQSGATPPKPHTFECAPPHARTNFILQKHTAAERRTLQHQLGKTMSKLEKNIMVFSVGCAKKRSKVRAKSAPLRMSRHCAPFSGAKIRFGKFRPNVIRFVGPPGSLRQLALAPFNSSISCNFHLD